MYLIYTNVFTNICIRNNIGIKTLAWLLADPSLITGTIMVLSPTKYNMPTYLGKLNLSLSEGKLLRIIKVLMFYFPSHQVRIKFRYFTTVKSSEYIFFQSRALLHYYISLKCIFFHMGYTYTVWTSIIMINNNYFRCNNALSLWYSVCKWVLPERL